jgi:hypothetical protein
MSKLMRVIVLVLVVLVGSVLLAGALGGHESQAAPVADAFPPCPPTDLEGRVIAASGLTRAGRLYCTYRGLANPCPTYWDTEITRLRRFPDGRVKCFYFKPAISGWD